MPRRTETPVVPPKPPRSISNAPDNIVLAAFNSCIDWAKWERLPCYIKNRIKFLACNHRIKPVCFFENADPGVGSSNDRIGFGLRVYMDAVRMNLEKTSDDEAKVVLNDGKFANIMDDDEMKGVWVRCPPSDWYKFIGTIEKEFFVLLPGGWYLSTRYQHDKEYQFAADGDLLIDARSKFLSQAKKFPESKANEVLAKWGFAVKIPVDSNTASEPITEEECHEEDEEEG